MKRFALLLLLCLGFALNAQVIIPVAYNPPSPLTANAGSDTTICDTCSVTLNAGVTGGSPTYTYLWSPSAGLDDPNIANPVATPDSTTTYTLTITDANNCETTSEVTVTVFYIGIPENFMDRIMVLPNPADRFLHLEFMNPIADELEFKLYSADAKLVKSGRVERMRSSYDIDVASFKSGIYTIQLQSGKLASTRQIVIQH